MNFSFEKYTGSKDARSRESGAGAASVSSWDCIPPRFHANYRQFALNSFQTQALRGIAQKGNLAVKAPTSAGKTYIQDVLYFNNLPFATLVVLPTKALLFERVQATYFAGFHVLHGESALRMEDLAHSLVYSTAEKAAELLTRRIASRFLKQLKLIVIDELHYAAEKQNVYATICFAAHHLGVRVCGFSAAFSNEMAAELGFSVQEYQAPRELQLQYEQIIEGNFLDLARAHPSAAIRSICGKVPALCSIVRQTEEYQRGSKILIFCPTKAICETVARAIATSRQEEAHPWNQFENKALLSCAKYGTAFHHSGLSASDKNDVQLLFTQGRIPVLASTSTLSVGVNVDPELVVIFTSLRFGSTVTRLEHDQIVQMAGRGNRAAKELKCLLVDDVFGRKWATLIERNAFFPGKTAFVFNCNVEDFTLAAIFIAAHGAGHVQQGQVVSELKNSCYFRHKPAADIVQLVGRIGRDSGLLLEDSCGFAIHPRLDRLFQYHVSYCDFVAFAQSYYLSAAALRQRYSQRQLLCFLHFQTDYALACAALEAAAYAGHAHTEAKVELALGCQFRAARPVNGAFRFWAVLRLENGPLLTGAFRPNDYTKESSRVVVEKQSVAARDILAMRVQNLDDADDFCECRALHADFGCQIAFDSAGAAPCLGAVK